MLIKIKALATSSSHVLELREKSGYLDFDFHPKMLQITSEVVRVERNH
jgi:hypothetical protein